MDFPCTQPHRGWVENNLGEPGCLVLALGGVSWGL